MEFLIFCRKGLLRPLLFHNYPGDFASPPLRLLNFKAAGLSPFSLLLMERSGDGAGVHRLFMKRKTTNQSRKLSMAFCNELKSFRGRVFVPPYFSR